MNFFFSLVFFPLLISAASQVENDVLKPMNVTSAVEVFISSPVVLSSSWVYVVNNNFTGCCFRFRYVCSMCGAARRHDSADEIVKPKKGSEREHPRRGLCEDKKERYEDFQFENWLKGSSFPTHEKRMVYFARNIDIFMMMEKLRLGNFFTAQKCFCSAHGHLSLTNWFNLTWNLSRLMVKYSPTARQIERKKKANRMEIKQMSHDYDETMNEWTTQFCRMTFPQFLLRFFSQVAESTRPLIHAHLFYSLRFFVEEEKKISLVVVWDCHHIA